MEDTTRVASCTEKMLITTVVYCTNTNPCMYCTYCMSFSAKVRKAKVIFGMVRNASTEILSVFFIYGFEIALTSKRVSHLKQHHHTGFPQTSS